MEVKPHLPAVGPADLREDLHARHVQQRSGEDRAGDAARPEGARAAGGAASEVPAELQAAFDKADEELFANVRNVFGGRLRQATTGAAPIAQEILEFFYACGVPVLEGYGMTETATAATVSTLGDHQLRHRRAAAARRRGPDRRRRRDPGPRPAHLPRLLQDGGHVVRRDRGRLAAHRRPRLARRGRLPLDHRPQEGHHHHRGRQEPHAREPGERPQAVALDLPGRHVRRPPALPRRAGHARPRGDRPLRARARPARGPRPRWPASRRCTS